MPTYKAMVAVEITIPDHLIAEGYNPGDIVQDVIGDALNESSLEWDITSVDTVDEVKA